MQGTLDVPVMWYGYVLLLANGQERVRRITLFFWGVRDFSIESYFEIDGA